jgi:methylthioribose-1-phosphate isomerase
MSQPPLAVEWIGDHHGHMRLLDQTRLPGEVAYIDCRTVETVWEAIRALRVRGAPAIGIAAAMGVVIGMQNPAAKLDDVVAHLRTSRPTAVNLFWALERMVRVAASAADMLPQLWREALAIRAEDAAMCHTMGRLGAALIAAGDGVLTHCNTGGLATAEYGTALAVLFTAHDQGKGIHVWVDETRPLLQGARLTAWELMQHGVPATLICDNMAAQVMKEGRVQKIFVGADRIAANGDAANKIGTYGVAVSAKHHKIPFYIVAPSTTFDLTLPDGTGIPIEERDPAEIVHGMGKRIAPEGMAVYNPAFDVTPAELISGIVTEKGIIAPVSEREVRRVLNMT